MPRAIIVTRLDPPFVSMEPVQPGLVSSGRRTPDRFVTVEDVDERPLLRVDLYRCKDECHAFEEACIWSRFVAVGWGHHCYFIELKTRAVIDFNLGSYFGHLYPAERFLLVASADRLFRIAPEGSLLWRTVDLGIDGVIVDQVVDGVIRGQGEWDPPGGWRHFQIRLDTGEPLN